MTCGAFAQTGILDSDAEFRKMPREAFQNPRVVPQAQQGLNPQAVIPRAPQAPQAQQAPQQPQRTPVPTGVQGNTPGQDQLGQPLPRMKYAPVNSDNLKINAVIDSLNTTRSERPVSGTHRKGDNPVIFLIGDSTMRTEIEGNGSNGQWGWGYYLENYFDTDKITVENHALGGQSTRSFYKEWLFHVLRGVKPGDWVIIQLGHNDRTGGEMNNGRYRGLLPGTDNNYTEVILPGSGTRERIYSYGEYLRIYIEEIRMRGATPILLTLTARNMRDEEGKTNLDSKNPIIETIAKEQNVPFIDFNSAIRHKYDNVFDSRKVDYLFFSDHIHTSSFGAIINAETFVEELRKRPDIGLSQFLLPEKRYESQVRNGDNPVLFVVGDSTAKIDNSEQSKQVGWGQVIEKYFNTKKITVDNQAKAGRSSRTYLNEGRWNVVYDALRPGDYVLIQFGHNDVGDINVGKARGLLPGNGDEKQIMTIEATGINEGIYTHGWYIRKYCLDVIEKGATPIVLSHTARNMRDENGKIIRNSEDFGKWSKEAAEQVGAYFIDMNEISAAKLDKLSKEEVDKHFMRDHTHTSAEGADRNAKSIVEGIKKLDLPLKKMLK